MKKQIEQFQNLNFTSKLSNFEVVNSEFTKCKCYILASGDNANGSDITEEAIKNAISRGEFFNKPVIAHLYKDEDNGKWRVGGHDSKWIISAEGIELVNECIPFGVIPESANVRQESVLEPDGITRNTYVVADIILWTGRYNIMDAAYSDELYFNQSCEITVNQYHFKDNDYLSIDDFTFSACCLLAKSDDVKKNVKPCFPSCRVEKINSFSEETNKLKENFEQLLATYKQYQSDNTSVTDINNKKEGEIVKMDFSKILEKLSEIKLDGSETAKYGFIDGTETNVFVYDRADFKAYSIDYAIVDEDIVFDLDHITECKYTAVALGESENYFDFKAEIDSAVSDAVSNAESSISETFAKTYNEKLDTFAKEYEELKSKYEAATAELNKFREEEAARLEVAKKAKIDDIVNEFAKKIGRSSSFLCWRSKLDYSKVTPEDVKSELTIMAGEIAMKDSKSFSLNESNVTVTGVIGGTNKNIGAGTERYGDLFAKFNCD